MCWTLMRGPAAGLVAALGVGCPSPVPAVPTKPSDASEPRSRDGVSSAATVEAEAGAGLSWRPKDADEPDGSASAAMEGQDALEVEAARAYVAALEAYAAKDAAAYFDAFADPMACFYGEESTPRSTLERARKPYFGSTDNGAGPLVTMAIVPVRVTPDEVVLIHWGIHRDGPGKKFAYPLFSRKALVMTVLDGQWKIAAEFSFGTSCWYGDVFRGVKAPRCVRGMGKCMTSCCNHGRGSGSQQCEYCEHQCAELHEACSTKLE